MKTPTIFVLIAIPTALLAIAFAFVVDASDSPVLLRVGIAGLGALTLVSERWHSTAEASEAAVPLPTSEGVSPHPVDAQS